MIAQLINSLKELWDIQMEKKDFFFFNFCFSKTACINTEIYKSFAADEELLPLYRWES